MAENVLIIGRETPLINALKAAYMNHGWNTTTALAASSSETVYAAKNETSTSKDNADSDAESDESVTKDTPPKNSRELTVPWHTRSMLSAKNILLSTEHKFGTIDEGIILLESTGESGAFHTLSTSDIETSMDILRGTLSIAKELSAHFQKKGRGRLIFVAYTGGAEVLAPLESAVFGGFYELASSLFTFYQNEQMSLSGFESTEANAQGYASYILNTLEQRGRQTSGKWYKYSEKGSFLSALTGSRRK